MWRLEFNFDQDYGSIGSIILPLTFLLYYGIEHGTLIAAVRQINLYSTFIILAIQNIHIFR